MSMEDLMGPAIVPELENADVAIRRCTGKETSTLMGSPCNHVHGRSVKGEIKDLCPSAAAGGGGRVLVLFTPDEHLAVIGRGGQDRAKFRMRLGV